MDCVVANKPSPSPTPTPTTAPSETPPAQLQSAIYLYDGDGNLVKSLVNGTTTYYPSRQYVDIFPATGGETIQKYYIVGSQTIAENTIANGTSTLHWLLSDQVNSTTVTANADGSWSGQILYTAFGEIRSASGNIPTQYRFTSQLAQPELGLDWYASRFYDPYLNHFVQPDSIIPGLDNSKVPTNGYPWDRFVYVNNNPISKNDPTGHCIEDLCIGETALAIAGATALAENAPEIESAVEEAAPEVEQVVSEAGPALSEAAGSVTSTIEDAGSDALTQTEKAADNGFGTLSKAAQYGIQKFNDLKNTLTKTGLQSHHLIEQRFAGALGKAAEDAKGWDSVAVTPEEHQLFTNLWRSEIGYANQIATKAITTLNATPQNIWVAAQKVYANHPILLQVVKQALNQ